MLRLGHALFARLVSSASGSHEGSDKHHWALVHDMSRRLTRVAAATALVLATLIVATLSCIDFYVARGSDAGASIYRVPKPVLLVSIVGALIAFLAATLPPRLRSAYRVLLVTLGVIVLAVATHVVSFNFHAESVDEFWFAVRVPRASLNPADGLEAEWNVRSGTFALVLTHLTRDESVYVFTGVSPWAVDVRPSLGASAPIQHEDVRAQ